MQIRGLALLSAVLLLYYSTSPVQATMKVDRICDPSVIPLASLLTICRRAGVENCSCQDTKIELKFDDGSYRTFYEYLPCNELYCVGLGAESNKTVLIYTFCKLFDKERRMNLSTSYPFFNNLEPTPRTPVESLSKADFESWRSQRICYPILNDKYKDLFRQAGVGSCTCKKVNINLKNGDGSNVTVSEKLACNDNESHCVGLGKDDNDVIVFKLYKFLSFKIAYTFGDMDV